MAKNSVQIFLYQKKKKKNTKTCGKCFKMEIILKNEVNFFSHLPELYYPEADDIFSMCIYI